MTFQQQANGIDVRMMIPNSISLAALAAFLVLTFACGWSNQPSSTSPGTTKVTSAVKNVTGGEGEFEGLVTMHINTADRKNLELTYFIKGNRSRVESKFDPNSTMQAIILCDTSTSKITTLMPKKKLFMTMDLEEERKALGNRGNQDATSGVEEQEAQFPKLTATGKQESIAGYPCEHWLMGDQAETDMCVAKGLGYFGMGNKLGGLGSLKNYLFSPHSRGADGIRSEWTRFLEGGAFPLKVTQTENGQMRMNMEATKIERQKLDDALFAVPADYKELKILKMPGQ